MLLRPGRLDVLGCDFLTVRDGMIVRKNSFRKQRPAAVPASDAALEEIQRRSSPG